MAGEQILVVDDTPANVRLLQALLGSRGYDVLTAVDGISALELVDSEHPDLILLDVVMPGLDGYAVCSRLRANEETAVLPVIMVTSSIGQEKTRAIEAGADDFLPKPFNHDRTRVNSSSWLNGFGRKSSAPASIALVFSWPILEVTMITGSTAVSSFARSRLQTAYPSRPGITTSSRISAGCSESTSSSAETPSAAVRTS